MLKRIFVVALCLGLGLLAYAQTQGEMNHEAKSDYEIADGELNRVYKKLRETMSEEEKAGLKEVQLLWLKYRDANAAFAASQYEGGSMAGMVYAGALTRATNDRTEALKTLFPQDYQE